jgi:two-component system nitrate/nitrite response regulator NarL
MPKVYEWNNMNLTPQEAKIAALVAQGMSNKEIAETLDLAQGTIKVHIRNIFRKLRISNRTTLAVLHHQNSRAA